MPDLTSNGMQCNEFDLLLSDALDGVLSGSGLDRFQAHAKVCKVCGPLLAEAEAGRNWLKGLTEVEPPDSLVNNILASTTGVDTQRLRVPVRSPQPRISWWEHLQASLLEPIWATVRQPRFAMSFGMAFFALSVGLTVAGVKPADLRQISLRPSAIRRTYYSTRAQVVHRYENIRLVYEVESRVRELKRNIAPTEPGPTTSRPAKPKDDKNDTTQQPEQKQERNYSQTDNRLILASAREGPSPFLCDLPVVSVTTYRRFV
ncbi:MAG TPA: zf-HC2 domain-containing protein [Candidatus Sulfotelmatobacter sp.]|nr:zf-HC2 domain-containing protein [Candidatus Sulfotelmatobacter sp.]